MKYDAQNICTSRKVVRESLASASDASRAFRSAVGRVEICCDKSSLLGMRRREDKLDLHPVSSVFAKAPVIDA